MTWFGNRELDFCPKHFVISSTPLKTESKIWVQENLKGRYTIIPQVDIGSLIDLSFLGKIAFEDPVELTFYELKWS